MKLADSCSYIHDPFLWRGIVLASFSLSGNCPVRKESLISKQIGSDTIDLNKFKSLIWMLKGPDALLEFKESIMSSSSNFVTGIEIMIRNWDFFKLSLGDLNVSGISLFTVLATLTKKLLKALVICFGSLRSVGIVESTEIWEINLDEDCWVLTIFLIPD